MTREAKKLLSDALRLPEEARGTIAGKLIMSIETESDPDAARRWDEEIRRRVEALDAGKVKTIPWEQVRREAMRLVRAHERKCVARSTQSFTTKTRSGRRGTKE